MKTVSHQPYSQLGLLDRAGVRRNTSALVVETVGANRSIMSVGLHECGARLAVVANVGNSGGQLNPASAVEYRESPDQLLPPGKVGLIRAVYALNVDAKGKLVVSSPIAWTSKELPDSTINNVNWNGAAEELMSQSGASNTRDLFIGQNGKIRITFGVVPADLGMKLPEDMSYYANLLVRDHSEREVTLAH